LVPFSLAEFHIPPARLSIAGNPKGKHAGALSFGYLFFEQASKEKSLAHEGRKTQLNSSKRIKKKQTNPCNSKNPMVSSPTRVCYSKDDHAD